jgi:YhcG PDDEXK nuclease domain
LLIDLKAGKFMLQDIGQIHSYIPLFDDQYTTKDENPPVGVRFTDREGGNPKADSTYSY